MTTTHHPQHQPEHASEHELRVRTFQHALIGSDIIDVIRQHITTGDPVSIPHSTYYELRRLVANRYTIHPSAVVLVGSCRLGFTLKPKGKTRLRYASVKPTSDVDVAIVAPALFDTYWDKVFDLVRDKRDWALSGGKKFARDLFCGWITPSELPTTIPRFQPAREWAEFFERLSRDRICGLRTINARLYRAWDRLEKYQEIMVSQCKAELSQRGRYERIESPNR